MRTLTAETWVAATCEEVWQRAVTPEGINHELMPVLRMTVPAAFRGRAIDDLPPGAHLGRSYFLLLGVLPVDYDDITVAEYEPNRRFLETSTMFSMPTWRHERTLTPEGDGCRVHDRVSFVLRFPSSMIPGWSSVVAAGLGALFRHRHRRLVRYFAARPTGVTAEGDQ